jgi:hypothetical protein
MRLAIVALLSTFCLLPASLLQAEEAPVSFSRDVRPILSNRCFKCHGFDPATREADLRLDTKEGLFNDHEGHRPFVAGRADQSEALRRILSDDPDERMPPPSAKKDLSQREIAILKKWVEQGTPWEPHWSFVAPTRPKVPEVDGDTWSRTPIDHFIFARLRDAGLTPSPEADRDTLIRRVSLDLTGLPPTPEEAEAFVNDRSPDAYDKLVERLLNSPAYGERWARRWLDLARYADTNGYEKDRPRNIWPWRDWVVKALNDNMPFDQFTIKQIAGDMLPNATEDDLIATGFHRNTMLNEEGGIDPLEFRYHAMTDRVATTGTTWLGLTTGCAQCHDHKYDPISHREYFGLMAFLNNADELELPLGQSESQETPSQSPSKTAELVKSLAAQWPVPKKDRKNAAAEPETAPKPEQLAETAFQEWLTRERGPGAEWVHVHPTTLSSNLPILTLTDEDIVFVTGDITKQDTYRVAARPALKGVTALRLEALPDPLLPAGGPGMTYYEGKRGDFFLANIEFKANGQPLRVASADASYSKNAFGATPATAAMAIDDNLQSGWGVAERPGERHVAVFRFAEPTDIDTLDVEMLFARHFASSLGKFRLSLTTSKETPVRDISPEAEKLLASGAETLSETALNTLRLAFFLQSKELTKATDEVRKALNPPPAASTLVFQERPPQSPRPTHLHHRGEYLQAKDEVPPVVPSFLNPLAADAPRNRLTFARWLVSRENPLTARVVVNQQWAALFGRGLVSTVQDFGFQGDPPSHPDLLDWLAIEFMDSGWNMKQLHRLIVKSSVYRQSSAVTPLAREKDSANILLSRANRTRLEAEMIRDSALAASGLLSRKVGGPPVKPPQPNSVTEAAYGAFKWEPSAGEDRFRRSLYTFMKRTAPFGMYAVFDGPSGEACVARRDVSNTPLQSLTLLNDEMFLEIARALGRRVFDHAGDDRKKVEHLVRLVLTRPADETELNDLVQFVAAQRATFKAQPDQARELAGTKEDTAVDVAPWIAVARAVLSLDEAVTRN